MGSLRADRLSKIRLAALALFGLLLCTADGRTLREARATSLSTGGTATSVSQSLGDSEVITAATAANGGDAAATLSADSGKHNQVTVADGTNSDTWKTSAYDGEPSSWNDVPACKANPSRINSVKDGSGRLWGYEDNTSCAYKDRKNHHPLFYWEAAPACPGSPGADSVTDIQGRVWGWAHGASCAYKPSFHRKLATFDSSSSSRGSLGSGLASIWQQLVPAAPDSTQQQSTDSEQSKPSSDDSTKSSPAAQEAQQLPAAAPKVQDAVVPFSDSAPRLHGTGNETLDKDIATESVAQAAADGSARAVAASSAVAAAGATINNTEVISHAEAHAESSASSWSWSPETGNITHQAKSEAHATADSVNGTTKASAFADASTDGLNSTAQSTAAVDGGRGKVVVQANASLRSLKTQEFAAPVDVPVAAVPYKADTGSTSKIQGPSHSNPADPTSNAVITTQADPQKPKLHLSAQPAARSNGAFAAVTNALAAAGQLVIGTAIPPTRPAVALPNTPPVGSDTTQCTVVVNESGQQAIKCNKVIAGPALNQVAPTNLLGGGNAQQFSAAEAPSDFEPSAMLLSPSPLSAPLPSPVADLQAVNGTIVAAPAANPAAAAVSPAASTAAPAASPAATIAVSPDPAVLAASSTAALAASPAATTAVSPAPTPAEVVAASPSPRPIIKHTITIIHDPTITDAVTSRADNLVTSTAQGTASNTITGGPQTLSGGVNITASGNSSSLVPAEPRSGLSLADYYDGGDASGVQLQDLPPQIPANSSQVLKNDSSPTQQSSHNSSYKALLPAPSSSSPGPVASGSTSAPAVSANPSIGSAVSRPAATPVGIAAPNAKPAAAEPTAEQPATSAFSPAAIKPAATVVNGTPASAHNSLGPADTHAPSSQSALQQPAKLQTVATPPVSPSPSFSASPSPTPAPMVISSPSLSSYISGSPPSSPAASPSLTVATPPPATQAPPSAVSSTTSPLASPLSSPTVSPSSSDSPTPASTPSASPASSPSPAADSIVDTSAKNLFGTAWQSAPACQSQPNKRNSVQDASGRLWWWEDNHSCAYRDPSGNPLYYAGYTAVKWETSPPCQFTATQINAMADANGRAWGWISESSTNCKFVKGDATQSGAALMYLDIPKQ